MNVRNKHDILAIVNDYQKTAKVKASKLQMLLKDLE